MTNLYHCLYRKPEGNALKATCERNLGHISGRFLFAATHLTKSLAFAFSYHEDNREVLLNYAIPDTENEAVVLLASSNPLEKKRNITVLEFSDEGFVALEEGSRQSVSTDDLPFSRTRVALETNDYKDLMRLGLQIFVIDDIAHPSVLDCKLMIQRSNSMEAMFASLIKAGQMRWINDDEGINPCKKFHRDIFAEIDPTVNSLENLPARQI